VTPDRTDANPDENAEHGILDESGNLDTASITILGGHIAQVNVDLPVASDDDIDDDVIEDEIPIDHPDLPLLDTSHERRSDEGDRELAHVHHVELLPTGDIILEPYDHSDDAAPMYGDDSHDVQDADLVDDEDGAETPRAHVPDADHVEHAEADAVAHDAPDTEHAESYHEENAEPPGAVHSVSDVDADDAEHTGARSAEHVENLADAQGLGHADTRGADHADALPTMQGAEHADAYDAEHFGVNEAHEPDAAEHFDMNDTHESDAVQHFGVNDAHEPDAAEHGEFSGAGAQTSNAHERAESFATGTGASHPVGERDGGRNAAHEPGEEAVKSTYAGTREDVRASDARDADVVDEVESFEADAADPDDMSGAGVTDAPSPQSAPGPDETPEHSDDVPEARDAAAVGTALTHAPWVPAFDRSRTDDNGPVSASAVETHEPTSESATAPKEDDVASENQTPDAQATASSNAVPSAATDSAPQRPGAQATGPVPARAAATPATGDAPATGTAAGSATAPASATAAGSATAPGTGPVTAVSDAAPGTGPVPATRAERAATGAIGTLPLTRRGAHQADEAARTADEAARTADEGARAADEAARVDRAHAMERVRTPAPEVTLTSKRIGQIDDARESSDLLTADRLLDPRQIAKPEPEGLWQQLVYSVSGRRINLGDGRRARDRKDLDQRIAAPLTGGARFVPVLSRKGGVGKTTVTSLLGMALADARDDRIIAVDANPDRGTLADRVGRPNGRTVRDLVRSHDEVTGYHDVSSIVARDATRLDVLASDADPRVSEAFSDDDYRHVAGVAAHYYSIVLTDTGTGIVHSVMGATLELAHTVVIVAGLSVDEARLASETLTWLETNGYAARVRDAVVVLNNSRPGAPLVRESELEAHFRSRVRTVIRMPYDSRIAAGSAITFRDLQPPTRQAARELAAAVVEGLRSPAAAA
jgi:MinD-like ATPase involved in chromosome partitioning or flagellar assembly